MKFFHRSKNESAVSHRPARKIRRATSSNRKTALRQRGLSFEQLEPRALLTATITVNDTVDHLDNPTNSTPATLGSTVSLRDAINAANNSSVATNIVFDPTVFSGHQVITLSQGSLSLNNSTAAITITGPGTYIPAPGANPSPKLVISGNNSTQVFTVSSGTTATFSDLVITNGHTFNNGGGINNGGTLTVDNSIIEYNSSLQGDGGGIYSTGTLTVNGSTFENNSAGEIGGGIQSYGPITVENSTFVNNSVSSYGQGGGVSLFNGNNGLFENCTFTQNSAPSGWGGALWIYGPTVTLDDCTFDGNTAANGSGIGSTNTSEVSPVLNNCIIADSVALYGSLVFSTQSANNLFGPSASGGLTANNSTGNIFESSISAMDLGTLSNNGGPTETIPLLTGSPAIDAGSNTLIPQGMTTDQRGTGYPRIANGTVDIGSFEVEPVATSTTVAPLFSSATYGQSVDFQATVSQNSGTAPTGSVQFYLDSVAFGQPVTLTGGIATSSSINTLTATSHTISAVYSPTGNFASSNGSDPFTIGLATPTVSVVDAGGYYNGSAYPASGSVHGLNGANLGTPTFRYYLASDTGFADPLSAAPSAANSYVVVASYAASGNYAAASAHVSFTITPRCDLSISSITASPTTMAGGTVEYTISVTNSGPSPAQNVSITDSLPSGITFASQSQLAGQALALSNAGSQINDTVASLPAGATVTFAILAGVSDGLTSNAISNTVSASTTTAEISLANNHGTASTTIAQSGVSLEPDPLDATKTDLVIGGTSGNDTITVSSGTGNQVIVVMNGHRYGPYAPTGRIVAYGRAGNDTISVSPTISLPAFLYGGPGNDFLSGGSGNNVLVGGDGNDVLVGNGAHNILIGGSGTDRLNNGTPAVAGSAQNKSILIGGATTYDNNDVALMKLLDEWTSGATFAQEVSNTRNGSLGVPLTAAQIVDDGAADLLNGLWAEADWFWNKSGHEELVGWKTGEQIN
jgi:uncharacterized repeat protein (TIGR01451 family)